jgi:SAM-dependent methyltransferase
MGADKSWCVKWIPFFCTVAQMNDRYQRVNYQALVDWRTRLTREWPFLERVLTDAPDRRLLDLGCGPGEHARLLASHGFDVVGVDASPSMVETARETEPSARFVPGDLADVGALVDGQFGGAICLGNTLPHITTPDALARLFRGLRQHLLPGAPVVLQLLNYERIFGTRQRVLPLTLRPSDDGTLVFLRLMDPRPDGRIVFSPTVLRYRPDAEPSVVLEQSERVELRGWTRGEVESALGEAGFGTREVFGSMEFGAYQAGESQDLVVVARGESHELQGR